MRLSPREPSLFHLADPPTDPEQTSFVLQTSLVNAPVPYMSHKLCWFLVGRCQRLVGPLKMIRARRNEQDVIFLVIARFQAIVLEYCRAPHAIQIHLHLSLTLPLNLHVRIRRIGHGRLTPVLHPTWPAFQPP
jgi:hypothetical protein